MRAAVIGGLALAGLAPPAWAEEPWSLRVTEDAELRYYHFPPEEQLPGFEDLRVQDYLEQVNRVYLAAGKGRFSATAQIDEVALLWNRYYLDDQPHNSWPLMDDSLWSPLDNAYLNLEKLSFQQRWAKVELTVGDTYASFGRGVSLNIVKNTDLDIDTSIRGAKAVFRLGKLDLTAISGLTNRQQVSQDNRNLALDRDVSHMVSGMRAEAYGVGRLNLGAHGVVYSFGREDNALLGLPRYAQAPDAVVGGATLEAPGLLGVDWFVEGDVFGNLAEELGGGDDPLLGYAGYGSASFYPGDTVVLIEVKRTQDTERLNTFSGADAWEVAQVPTLEFERVITEDSSAAVNSNDLAGARARVDIALPHQITPYVSAAAFRDCDTEGLHFNETPETIVHPIAGLQALGAHNNLQAHLGYRVDMRDEVGASGWMCDAPAEITEGLPDVLDPDRLAHLDLDGHLGLGEHDGIELILSIKHYTWGTNAQQQSPFLEMSNALSYQRGEKWALTLYQDYSDNAILQSEGNLTENLYGAAEVQYKPTSSVVVRAFYGAYKAGIHCAGGQCRYLPGFEGARLSFNGTF